MNNVVLIAYSNKAHDGFLGNSVLGEWCNIGAGTNNSNLKNTYVEVKLWDYETRRFQKTDVYKRQEEVLKPYTDPDSEKYKKMLEVMAEHLQLDSLKFQRLEDIVRSIGLPKEELCTHCWDNSSYM